MGVNNGVNIRPSLIDHAVHWPLGRDAVLGRLQRLTIQVDDDHHLRLHPTLAYTRGSSDDPGGRDADTDITVSCNQQIAVITPRRQFDNLFPNLSLILHPSSFILNY